MPKGTPKKKEEPPKENMFLRREIFVLASFALCAYLMLSHFGIGGMVGDVLSDFLFGIFGFIAYVIPLLFFGAVLFYVSNRGSKKAIVKLIAGVILVLFISALSELIANSFESGTPLLDYYRSASELRNGGGILGGLLVSMLATLLGVVGAYLVFTILSIICLILITEKSLLIPLKKGSRMAYNGAYERHQNSKRRREEERSRCETEPMEPVSLDGRGPHVPKLSEIKLTDQEAQEKAKRIREMFPITLETVHTPLVMPDGNREIPLGDVSVSTPGSKVKKAIKSSAEVMTSEVLQLDEEIRITESNTSKQSLPPISLLKRGKKGGGDSEAQLSETAYKLEQVLYNFGVNAKVTDFSRGPSVTRYEIQPEQGVKVSRIVGLADDIKLNLAVADLRIEAPIPGKAAVGIEVPNKENTAIMLRDLLETDVFKKSGSLLSFAVGMDISGKTIVADIAKMPHLLVAGATGSGKSVCINTLIMSILYKANAEDVKLIMIDPKVVELSVYNGIPHLMIPVVTDPKKAAGALNWAVAEMTKRYQLFAEQNVRDLKGYNEKIAALEPFEEELSEPPQKMPQIVIIVDELADLMMVAPGEVESAICRLAQLARAAGIHLILATQRPSVNVITGLIKANMPSRIAFSVASGVDSRTIIDMNGAEKLLGRGDMLFYPTGYPKPVRVQGSFVSDEEVQKVVDYLKLELGKADYDNELEAQITTSITVGSNETSDLSADEEGRDAYFAEAGRLIIEKDKASIGMLQRMLKVGFNRAARIMDQLHEAGVVGGEEGTKPRKILMTIEEFEDFL